MTRLKTMSEAALRGEIQRLKRSVEDFSARAEREAAALEREGRPSISAPLHQRLTLIRNDLRKQLTRAEDELARRAKSTPKRRPWSLRTAFASLSGAQS
jgi:hypothetical protein